MSFHGDDSRSGTPHSKFSEEVELDEEHIPGILKSLIDQQKLQGAWSRYSKRLRSVESNLTQAQGRLDNLSLDFVPMAAYQDLVETQHAAQLAAHAKALERLDELTGRLSCTVFEEHQVQLYSSLGRLTAQEEVCQRIDEETGDNKRLLKDLRETFVARLGNTDHKFQQHQQQNTAEHTKLQEELQESFQKLWKDLKGCEDRMQRFAEDRVQKAVKDSLSFDKGGDQNAEDGDENAEVDENAEKSRAFREQFEKRILEMIDRELVDTIRTEQSQTSEKLTKLGGDVDQQRIELIRRVELVGQKASSALDNLNTHKKEIHQDLEKRPFSKDLREVDELIRQDLGGLSGICEGLQTRTVHKLNEFVDHVAKLHETIDDHEHCLRHHAEEIENRGTKYDLLLCQSQIDKCVGQEQYDEKIQDLQKVVAWQTNKIENFGLGGMGGGRGKTHFKGHGMKAKHHSKSGQHSMSQSRTSFADPETGSQGEPHGARRQATGETVSPVGRGETLQSLPDMPENIEASHDEGTADGDKDAGKKSQDTEEEPKEDKGDAGKKLQSTDDDRGGCADDDEGAAFEFRETQGTQGSLNRSMAAHDMAMDPYFSRLAFPEDDATESGRASAMSASSSALLSKQLEAVAMALVGIANLTLAAPKLGMSSHVKNEQKAEMLVELGNLRHWVTHKFLPPGWDPGKLTTMALTFTHQETSPKLSRATLERREKGATREARALARESSGEESPQMARLPLSLRRSRNQLHSASEVDLHQSQVDFTGKMALGQIASLTHPFSAEKRQELSMNATPGGGGMFRGLHSAREKGKSRPFGVAEHGALPPLSTR